MRGTMSAKSSNLMRPRGSPGWKGEGGVRINSWKGGKRKEGKGKEVGKGGSREGIDGRAVIRRTFEI